MGMWQRIFKKESLDTYMTSDGHFEKSLNAKDLVALGIGAVIGSGIFVLPGTVAATTTGPAIILVLFCGLSIELSSDGLF